MRSSGSASGSPSSTQATALLYGIEPVIIAVIVQALWGLTKTAVKQVLLAAVGPAVLAMYFLGISPIALLFGGGLLVMFIGNIRGRSGIGGLAGLMPSLSPCAWAGGQIVAGIVGFSLVTLFLTFLKIGALVYGGSHTAIGSGGVY